MAFLREGATGLAQVTKTSDLRSDLTLTSSPKCDPENERGWQPLPSEFHVRLLSIDPLRSDDITIRCSFELASLAELPAYHALSYAWGKPLFTETIYVDGVKFPVTVALMQALGRIREHWDEDRLLCNGQRPRLWVDALCINQADVEERNAQVTLMSVIYSKAQSVLIWLGETNQNVEFQTMMSQLLALPPPLPADATDRERLDQVTAIPAHINRLLLSKPWFYRRWAVQEVLLQEQRWLLAGPSLVPFRNLEALLTLTGNQSWKCRPNPGAINRTLLENLLICRETRCSQDMDLIYALRAISIDGHRFRVDYGREILALFTDLGEHYAKTEWLPLLLVAATGFNNGQELPTWVPDWRFDKLTLPQTKVSADKDMLLAYKATFELLFRRDLSWLGALKCSVSDSQLPAVLKAVPSPHPALVLHAWVKGPCSHLVGDQSCAQCRWTRSDYGEVKYPSPLLESDSWWMYLNGSPMIFVIERATKDYAMDQLGGTVDTYSIRASLPVEVRVESPSAAFSYLAVTPAEPPTLAHSNTRPRLDPLQMVFRKIVLI